MISTWYKGSADARQGVGGEVTFPDDRKLNRAVVIAQRKPDQAFVLGRLTRFVRRAADVLVAGLECGEVRVRQVDLPKRDRQRGRRQKGPTNSVEKGMGVVDRRRGLDEVLEVLIRGRRQPVGRPTGDRALRGI